MANSEIIGAGQDTARPAPKINTITCGDCLEVMQNIPDKSVDMILCDLPYGTTACKWDIIIPFELLWKQYMRICVGAVVLFGTEPFSSYLRLSNILKYQYDWIWEKERPTNIFNMKYQAGKVHETISVFNSVKYNPIMEESIQPNNNDKKKNKSQMGIMNIIETINRKAKYSDNYNPLVRYPRSVLHFIRSTKANKKLHPTQKPVPLFEYLIRTYTNEGDTVLDNCIGSGTTAIACINTGRNFIGIEKEGKYCRIAEERIHALRSPAQNTVEICHTAPNSGSTKAAQP